MKAPKKAAKAPPASKRGSAKVPSQKVPASKVPTKKVSAKKAVKSKAPLAKVAVPKATAKKIAASKKVAVKSSATKKASPKRAARTKPSPAQSDDATPIIRVGAQPKGPVVADVISKRHRQLVSVKTKVLLTTTAQLFARHRMSLVVVVDDEGKFNGVLSERDVVKAMGAFGARAAAMTVGEVNTRKVKACSQETPLDLVLQTMREGGFHHMPVVTAGRIEAIIGVVDVLAHLAGKTEAIIGLYDGPPIPTSVSPPAKP